MKKVLASISSAAILLAGAAQAAVLDFVAEAAGNERGVADGTVIVFDGLAVTFSASGPNGAFAYFDDLSSGRPAGLGVCDALEGPPPSECDVASHDNIQVDEAVQLAFAQTVSLSGFSFNDDEHFSLNSSNSTLLLNGVSFTFADVANLTAAVAAVVTNITNIEFAYGGDNPAAFYVAEFTANEIPLPAAAPLLLAGVAGLSFAARRRRKS